VRVTGQRNVASAAAVVASIRTPSLGKLRANWRSVVENVVESREERAERQRAQKRLFE
jgi:hypothetical protein